MRICTVEKCGRKHDARGLCQTHRLQLKKWGYIKQTIEPRYFSKSGVCEIIDCSNAHYAKGLCSKHNAQKTRYGGIKRTANDRNEIVVCGDISKIKLYNRKNEVIAEAIIDTADVDMVKPFKWHVAGKYNHVMSSKISLHSLIMGAKHIDHINRNPLDNRRRNLRLATPQQNSWNTNCREGTRSGYKGVCFDKTISSKSWKARIKKDGKSFTIGRYSTSEEAAWMYDQWAMCLFGEYAKLNHSYSAL